MKKCSKPIKLMKQRNRTEKYKSKTVKRTTFLIKVKDGSIKINVKNWFCLEKLNKGIM